MPSFLVGYPVASGAMPLISGNPWSGSPGVQGKIVLKLDRTSSGNVYVGLSGGILCTSGGAVPNVNSGLLDGFVMHPGDTLEIPRIAINASGSYNVYLRHDAACSGQGRLYYEKY